MGMLEFLIIFGLPPVLVGLFVLPFLRVGVELADEGYLVFGTAKVLDGQIPIRDFRAYDPGRYYWCGLFALAWGRGYLATRIAMAVAMTIALSLLAALVLSATGAPLLSALTCALVLIWMQPRTKQIENFFVILSCFLLFNVTGEGSQIDHLALGLMIGISAFFGLNTFAYLTAATALTFLLAVGLPSAAMLASFALGLGLGFTPVVVIALFAKGYARVYGRRKVLALLKRGTTNLKLPLPWLWVRGRTGFQSMTKIRRLSFMALFTLMPVVFSSGLSLPFIFGVEPLSDPARLIFVASCVGLVHFHHTTSRADLVHMFQPMLCLILVLCAASSVLLGPFGTAVLLVFAIIGSVALVWTEQFHPPGYLKCRDTLKPFDCATDRLFLLADMTSRMEEIQEITQEFTEKGEPILAVPLQIGLCAMLERAHASYDSFPVYPSDAAARKAMMSDLAKSRPKLVLVESVQLDQRKDLVFFNNYPEVTTLIATDYRPVKKIGRIEVFARSDIYQH